MTATGQWPVMAQSLLYAFNNDQQRMKAKVLWTVIIGGEEIVWRWRNGRGYVWRSEGRWRHDVFDLRSLRRVSARQCG